MIKVLKAKADGTALISTKDRFRVLSPKGTIVAELVERRRAEMMVRAFKRHGATAKILSYADVAKRM